MNKKNVLFISSWFPNKLEPTNGNFVQRHAEAVNLLHHVEVLHAIGDDRQKEIFLLDDQIINGIRTLIVYYKNTQNPALNFIRRMKAYHKGFKQLTKPDIVHANVLHNNMMFAVYLKKRFKIPFVVTEHWTALRQINAETTSSKIKKTAKFIGNQASYLMPVSDDLKKSLINLGIKKPMKVIPNVVNTKLFKPNNKRPETFTFLHVSSLIPRKNFNKILDVSIRLLEKGFIFNLQLGGDGDEVTIAQLKKKVQESGHSNQIEIFGTQTLNEVADRMANANCFILFSEDENQPCVIAEAFASGTPVISTNVGGIAEFFPENFGVLIEKTDPFLLEEAMKRMLNNDNVAEREIMANYAKNNFSKEHIANAFSEIYLNVLKQ